MKQRPAKPTSMQVVRVHTSTDGKVRAADNEYKLPGESVFRTTTRPIHKLVLVVPAEEQAIAGGQEEEGDAGAERPALPAAEEPGPVQQEEARASVMAPLAIGEPEPPRQEEVGVTETERGPPGEGPQETMPQPAKERQREPKAVVKCKKVISRKKAGKQARTIIVSVPKEEEEMVDVGVRPKKRGRPRKAPGMDPPDPRKGSVPDPGKGVCADPMNGGAILGKGRSDPQSGNKERQLSPDKGRDKT
jgi:hypothetical protein